MTLTRRTHIVRIYDKPAGSSPRAPGDPPPSETYLDVEVLDAVAFRTANGEEMVLNCAAEKAVTYIVDDTGGKNGQTPAGATRRSHMKRITNKDDPSQQLDIEVLDYISFRDKNGEEWILDMNSTNGDPGVFNSTDDSGDRRSTRRVHSEKVSSDIKDKDPAQYLTVERCDAMAFRTINGKEMIISCPSSDDPSTDAKRAETHVWSPEGYDPTDPSSATPPENTDSSIYLSFVDGAAGFMTGDAKISQGPLWWIKNIAGGEILVVRLDISKRNFATPHGFGGGGDLPAISGPAGALSGVSIEGVNFTYKASNIDGPLTKSDTDPTPLPKMPQTAKEKPAIKLKDDIIWWTAQPNTEKADDWTVLLFFNVGKIKKDDPAKTGEVKIKFTLPGLRLPDTAVPLGIGHYIWVVSGGTIFAPIPIHPPPTAAQAFGPYPFHDAAADTYLGLWNGSGAQNLEQLKRQDFDLWQKFTNNGINPSDWPGSNGSLGFATAAGAAAWCGYLATLAGIDRGNALTTLNAAEAADDPANAPHWERLKDQVQPVPGYVPLTLDFGLPPGSTPKPIPSESVTFTVTEFTGKTFFDYDTKNIPKFDLPKDPAKSATQTFSHVAQFNGSEVTILRDKTGKLTITEKPF